MEPKTLSASAILAYENCPAGYKAMYIDRARETSGVAADLGNAAHDALMEWVVHDNMDFDRKLLLDRFDRHASALGLPHEQHEAGLKMLKKLYKRLEDEPPYMVLQAEAKESFPLKVDGTTIDVTYIWDRCDKWEDGSIEVVDYKTWFQSLDAATMKRMVQVRIYALAAAIKYKKMDPPNIWVTLDQLRYNPVSVKFSREDHRETYAYLQDVARRILADPGTLETVNPNCRYCVRKASCETLANVIKASPEHILATDDPHVIARRAAELAEAIKAAEAHLEELNDWNEEWLEEHEIPEFTFDDGIQVKFSPTNRRKADSERIAKVVGSEITSRFGHFSMEDIDSLLKGDEISIKQKDEIRALIRTTTTTRVVATFKKQ